MATIQDYASLTQAILDWTHRSNLSSYTDYFIQAAQSAIEHDIPDLNFGNYIRFQEAAYGPFPIANGVCPVPSDWLGPKLLNVSDAQGNQWQLSSAAASWIYDNYPTRQATDLPAYFARDVWQDTYALPQTFTASGGQTAFTLSVAPTASTVLLVSLDGAVLTQGVSYTLSGTTLTLSTGAAAGQVLSVLYLNNLASQSGTQTYTATSGQTSFALSPATASVIAATLDGAVLSATSDYTVSGGYLQLTEAASAGQVLTIYLGQGSVLIFGPYPDQSYSVQGTYYQQAPLLSSSTTTNWMVLNAPLCLHAACMKEAAMFLKDAQMFQTWEAIYQQKLKALVDADKAERWAASAMAVNVG